MDNDLPDLDPDAGLVRDTTDGGDEGYVVQVMTAAEALDYNARFAERGMAASVAHTAASPDEVPEDGRPVAVHDTPAAKRQIDSPGSL